MAGARRLGHAGGGLWKLGQQAGGACAGVQRLLGQPKSGASVRVEGRGWLQAGLSLRGPKRERDGEKETKKIFFL